MKKVSHKKINFEDEELQAPSINMIPLIDVMLVLLVIFMLTASVATTEIIKKQSILLNLPKTNAELIKNNINNLNIKIIKINISKQDAGFVFLEVKNSNANLSLNTNINPVEKIKISELAIKLQKFQKVQEIKSATQTATQPAFQIYADKDVAYQNVADILAILQSQSFEKIELILEKN